VNDKQEGKPRAGYTKSQLVASKRFSPIDKDILQVVLADDQHYTINQAEQAIERFKKKEAK
jgi:hypothetical protein